MNAVFFPRHALFGMFVIIVIVIVVVLLFRCLFSFIALIVFLVRNRERKRDVEYQLGHSTLCDGVRFSLAVALVYPYLPLETLCC